MPGRAGVMDERSRFDGTSRRPYDVVRSAGLDANHLTVVKKLRAGGFGVANKAIDHCFNFHDANRGNEDSAQGVNRRDAAHAALRHHKFEGDVLPPALPPQIPERAGLSPQAGANTAVRNRDEHSGSQEADATLFGIPNYQLAAFARHSR